MQCIFLKNGNQKTCHAAVFNNQWIVDEKALKELCEKENFKDCPRFMAYLRLQESMSTVKIYQK